MRLAWPGVIGFLLMSCAAANSAAQTALTWAEVRTRFRTTNPTLQAGATGIEESKAAEITAFLRPNPLLSLTADQIALDNKTSQPLADMNTIASVSYLHERRHKRELRRASAREATAIAVANQDDLERNLVFTLRATFVQILQAKAFRSLAQDNLANYDRLLELNRHRFEAGDIARIDLDRLQLQRVQYESDAQTADVNLRTAKIQLLRLLNDQTPVEQFDVAGPFDFAPPLQALDEVRRVALETRPDLRAAVQAIEKARTDHRLAIANGSTDPTISLDAGFPSLSVPASSAAYSYNPPLFSYVGASVSVPLRIFDRNQGEKLRTKLDIARNEHLTDAARLQVFSDVDTAFATVMSTVALLQPYKATYLAQATRVRDTIAFSYQRGGASLLDLLQSQQEYRSVQISYVNLVAAFLNATNQLNLAVGQEVIQ
jgi:cobalt-zinc-cadmium efflux system outer membrane protein